MGTVPFSKRNRPHFEKGEKNEHKTRLSTTTKPKHSIPR